MEYPIKVSRLISNQLIIGGVQDAGNLYLFHDPYYIIPTEHGLQFFPMDAEVLGVDLQLAKISKQNSLYCASPSEEISDSYKRAIQGQGTPAIEQEVTQSIIT